MKKLFLFLTLSLAFFSFAGAQVFPHFEITGTHQGTGTFENAVLPDFTWTATGSINGEVQILNDEVFDDGNAFEETFGQADNAENLRTQVIPNGAGTSGQPITSKSKLTVEFENITPGWGWGFCIVDIDVENCLISAIDENDDEVPVDVINRWLVELFDCNLTEDGVNLPKWDSTHAAMLGADTPDDYTVYDSIVIGGMPDSEAASAFFMPDIPLKKLIIKYENLQDIYYTSYHFYIASESATGMYEKKMADVLIYPNPAVSVISLQSAVFSQQPATIEIFDINGRKLLEKQISAARGEIKMDVSTLPAGIYCCKINSEKGLITKKLLIRK